MEVREDIGPAMRQNDKKTQRVKSGAQVRWSAWLGCARDLCEAIWKGFCPTKRKRLELRFLSYPEADKLIRETNGAWTIAKEEDKNHCIGWVYLERLEEYQRFDKQPNDQS